MSEAVAILAGGRSTRMGQDKSFVMLDGKPLIQHVIEQVHALDLPVILISNQPKLYQRFNLPLFTDVLPGNGSLGGLLSALCHAAADSLLCVGCDMPFLNSALLRHLLDLAAGHEAVVPLVNSWPEGLHAVYNQSCLPLLIQQLHHGDLKIAHFLRLLNVNYVEENVLRQFDPTLRSFVNINTTDDLASAQVRLGNQLS